MKKELRDKLLIEAFKKRSEEEQKILLNYFLEVAYVESTFDKIIRVFEVGKKD